MYKRKNVHYFFALEAVLFEAVLFEAVFLEEAEEVLVFLQQDFLQQQEESCSTAKDQNFSS